MKIKTLFFPLILSVVNFGCLNNLTNPFSSSSDSNYPASSASDYPEITKQFEEMKNEYKVSSKKAEKKCLTFLKTMGEIIDLMPKAEESEKIQNAIVKKSSKLKGEEDGAMCAIAISHKILSQDLNGAKKIMNKNCAVIDKMNEGVDCKQLYEQQCSSGNAAACEMKKVLF